MSMKNEDAVFVDLEEISTNYKYAVAALLVDKNEFLEMLKHARRSLGIVEPLKYDSVEQWLSGDIKRQISVNTIINEISHKFKKGFNFSEIIKYALLANKVTDNEFTHSAFCQEYPFTKEFEDAEPYLDEPMVAIFVNPDTKTKEVEGLMNTEVKFIFEQLGRNRRTLRKSKNIRKVRKWYWLKKDMSFNKLFKLLNKDVNYEISNDDVSYEKLKRAVERYTLKLKGDTK